MVRPPYGTVLRCFGIAEEHWESIDGEAALKGRPSILNLTVNRFCNAVLQWGVAHTADPQKFLDAMKTPIGAKASDAQLEREAKENAAFFSAFGGGAGSMGDGDANKA